MKERVPKYMRDTYEKNLKFWGATLALAAVVGFFGGGIIGLTFPDDLTMDFFFWYGMTVFVFWMVISFAYITGYNAQREVIEDQIDKSLLKMGIPEGEIHSPLVETKLDVERLGEIVAENYLRKRDAPHSSQ